MAVKGEIVVSFPNGQSMGWKAKETVYFPGVPRVDDRVMVPGTHNDIDRDEPCVVTEVTQYATEHPDDSYVVVNLRSE